MKRRSITRRLFQEIILLILSFSIILLIANSLLLKPLYYRSIRNDMKNTLVEIAALYDEEGLESVIDSIRSINQGNAFDISIISDDAMVYSSSMDFGLRDTRPRSDYDGNYELDRDGFEPDLQHPERDKPELDTYKKDVGKIPEVFVEGWVALDEFTDFGTHSEPMSDNELFVSRRSLDEGVVIYLTQGVEPVLDSVSQANFLLLTVSAIFLVIAMMIAFRISKNFTRPIRTMQNHVGRLADMNFDEELSILTGDELEELGRDINHLSDSLQNAMTKLKVQNEQLEREVVSQRKFISNASHELRTPLSLIKGYADEIASGFVRQREQEHTYVGYIAEESTKMNRLLNEILELSRIDSGRMAFHYEEVDVKRIIEGFVDKYEGFIEENGLNLKLELTSTICRMDVVRFEQILANYLSNSAKYADKDKSVCISTEINENRCKITVFNTGTPIPKNVSDFIWDGFYKADEARTSSGSYGLGLSIVKAIQQITGMGYGTRNVINGVEFWFEVETV